MPAPPCKPDCQCGKHIRSQHHNTLIGLGVQLTSEAKGLLMTRRAIQRRVRWRRTGR